MATIYTAVVLLMSTLSEVSKFTSAVFDPYQRRRQYCINPKLLKRRLSSSDEPPGLRTFHVLLKPCRVEPRTYTRVTLLNTSSSHSVLTTASHTSYIYFHRLLSWGNPRIRKHLNLGTMAHIPQYYDDSAMDSTHITSSESSPSSYVPVNQYYSNSIPTMGNYGETYSSYTTNSAMTGTSSNMSRFNNQPVSYSRVPNNSLYSVGDYGSTEGDMTSSSGTSISHSTTDPFDYSMNPGINTSPAMANAAGSYGHMYSHDQGAPALSMSPPALSPTSTAYSYSHSHGHGHSQSHQRHSRQASRPRRPRQPHHSAGFSPEASSPASGGGAGAGKSRLRSASRTSKNTHHNPPATAEERKSRETHNNVEKQYRNRLNAHFESLLSALPEDMQSGEGNEGGEGGGGGGGGGGGDPADRRVSKAEVLDMARRHINTLERECAKLEDERDELRESMEKLQWLFGRCEGGGDGPSSSSSSQGGAAAADRSSGGGRMGRRRPLM
ncbi:hypothetical protein F4778DRAFT_801427 [Xylariomycetidae sp. FL2044]|nr:hypothetical protein F4778DRAFT_801427 [Xylariomycetidae sp. FL2044]